VKLVVLPCSYEIFGDPYIDIDLADKGQGRVLQNHVTIDTASNPNHRNLHFIDKHVLQN
jgi:hypothetical protein